VYVCLPVPLDATPPALLPPCAPDAGRGRGPWSACCRRIIGGWHARTTWALVASQRPAARRRRRRPGWHIRRSRSGHATAAAAAAAAAAAPLRVPPPAATAVPQQPQQEHHRHHQHAAAAAAAAAAVAAAGGGGNRRHSDCSGPPRTCTGATAGRRVTLRRQLSGAPARQYARDLRAAATPCRRWPRNGPPALAASSTPPPTRLTGFKGPFISMAASASGGHAPVAVATPETFRKVAAFKMCTVSCRCPGVARPARCSPDPGPRSRARVGSSLLRPVVRPPGPAAPAAGRARRVQGQPQQRRTAPTAGRRTIERTSIDCRSTVQWGGGPHR